MVNTGIVLAAMNRQAAVEQHSSSVSAFAWGVYVFTVGVILYGALVRITGSGAGCGQHWPTCHGEILHLPQSVETIIELTHRITSGIDLLLVIALTIVAWKKFRPGHPSRSASVAAVFLMITEALIGARLVLGNLVGMDMSMSRVTTMSLHLLNTSFLVAALLLVAWSSSLQHPFRWSFRGSAQWVLFGSLVLILFVSSTGAITALGDTVFPVDTSSHGFVERIAADQSIGAHFLQRVRLIHPATAAVVAVVLSSIGLNFSHADQMPHVRIWGRSLAIFSFIQVVLGVATILLGAPGWMQVTHLAFATMLWSVAILLTASVCCIAGDQ